MELNEVSYTAHDSGPYSLFVPAQDDNGWYAGFWLRAFASLWDIFVLGILQVLLIQAASWAVSDSSFDVLLGKLLMLSERHLDSLNHHLFLLLLFAPTPCILFVSYFSLFESGRLGATPGKLLMGICVIDYEDNPPGLKQSIFRNTMKLLWMPVYVTGIAITAAIAQDQESLLAQGLLVLSTLMSVLLFLFTFMMVAFHADRQSYYDEWANCFVVRKDRVAWHQRLLMALLIILIYLWLLGEYLPGLFRKSGLPLPVSESSVPAQGVPVAVPEMSIDGTGSEIPLVSNPAGGETEVSLPSVPVAGDRASSLIMPSVAGSLGAPASSSPLFAGRQSDHGGAPESAENTGGGSVTGHDNLEANRNSGVSSAHATSSEALTGRPTQEKIRKPVTGLK